MSGMHLDFQVRWGTVESRQPMNAPGTSTAPVRESQRLGGWVFAPTILLSAFLLFQVQPLIAKLILPWFGGSAAVWTTCMLFFQMALLGGYAYAHWLRGLDGRAATIVHLLLLGCSILFLPILPSGWWKPHGTEDPLLRILGLLTATVGLPYFLLSSTSPLLQSWYSQSNKGAMPYRFFALSNAGSMLGLLTYPVLIEPYLRGRQQAWSWSIAYGTFVLGCGIVALRSRHKGSERAPAQTSARPLWSERLLWMALAACASALLLAMTNHLTQNIAAIPFLWILPLSLYLLSFILCFDSDRWYNRWLFTRLGAVALVTIAYGITGESVFSNIKVSLGLFSTALFVVFMVCHGELARRRPEPEHLTSFYLMVAVGGAVGGLLIALAAPYLLNGLYDLPIVVVSVSVLLLCLFWKAQGKASLQAVIDASFLDEPYDKVVGGALVTLFFVFVIARLLGARLGRPDFLSTPFLQAPYDSRVLLGITGAIALYILWRGRGVITEQVALFSFAVCITVGITGYLIRDVWDSVSHSRLLVRNFYGALQVYDTPSGGPKGEVRVLKHGTIEHGEEFLTPLYQRQPTTYYSSNSGVGRAIRGLERSGPLNVGVIGLGAGTIAAYSRAGDHYTFYDINPLVLNIARNQFRFLPYSPASVAVELGDARLSLERESPRHFDVLAVDAFSGDAIPVHLLTREAFALYWRHLKPDGVLAVHVSNHYLDLGPVVSLAAAETGKQALMVSVDEDSDEEAISLSDWVLVTSRPGFFDLQEVRGSGEPISGIPGLRTWTDDYSNLYRILR